MSTFRRLVLCFGLWVGTVVWAQTPLRIHFFDVGQGDAALIIAPNGKTVLVDGGPPQAAEPLRQRLSELVKGPLDLIILSHAHLDHLGGLGPAVEHIGAARFLDPGYDHSSDAYLRLLKLLGSKVGQVMTPQPNPEKPDEDVTIGLGEGARLTVFWPRAPVEPFLSRTRSDVNSNSIVFRLTYGETSFLFMGDAEPNTEAMLLRRRKDLQSNVLKVGHHGGSHSSTAAFLAAVKPQYAVISCGADNSYGHPAERTLNRLAEVGTRVLRTDVHGEILATSDGKRVRVSRFHKRTAGLSQ